MSQKPSNAWPAILESSAASDMIVTLLRAIKLSEPPIRKAYDELAQTASGSAEGLGYALHNLSVATRTTEQTLRCLARREKQRVLFAGTDCLPGQRDLFETDGEMVQPGA